MRQGTTEWYAARCGKITASKFSDAMARNKSGKGLGVAAESYLYELLGERLTGRSADEGRSDPKACEYGHYMEGEARAAYQMETGRNIAEFGFMCHDEHPTIGGSADGIILDRDGIIEIKAPWTCREHSRTLVTLQVPRKYVAQVQGNLWVSRREFCDFVSYDPRFPAGLKCCILTVERDESYIEKLSKLVTEFASIVDEKEKELRSHVGR